MVKLALGNIKAWLLPDSSTVAQCRQLKLLTRIWALAGVYDISLPADLDALYGKAIIVSAPDDTQWFKLPQSNAEDDLSIPLELLRKAVSNGQFPSSYESFTSQQLSEMGSAYVYYLSKQWLNSPAVLITTPENAQLALDSLHALVAFPAAYLSNPSLAQWLKHLQKALAKPLKQFPRLLPDFKAKLSACLASNFSLAELPITYEFSAGGRTTVFIDGIEFHRLKAAFDKIDGSSWPLNWWYRFINWCQGIRQQARKRYYYQQYLSYHTVKTATNELQMMQSPTLLRLDSQLKALKPQVSEAARNWLENNYSALVDQYMVFKDVIYALENPEFALKKTPIAAALQINYQRSIVELRISINEIAAQLSAYIPHQLEADSVKGVLSEFETNFAKDFKRLAYLHSPARAAILTFYHNIESIYRRLQSTPSAELVHELVTLINSKQQETRFDKLAELFSIPADSLQDIPTWLIDYFDDHELAECLTQITPYLHDASKLTQAMNKIFISAYQAPATPQLGVTLSATAHQVINLISHYSPQEDYQGLAARWEQHIANIVSFAAFEQFLRNELNRNAINDEVIKLIQNQLEFLIKALATDPLKAQAFHALRNLLASAPALQELVILLSIADTTDPNDLVVANRSDDKRQDNMPVDEEFFTPAVQGSLSPEILDYQSYQVCDDDYQDTEPSLADFINMKLASIINKEYALVKSTFDSTKAKLEAEAKRSSQELANLKLAVDKISNDVEKDIQENKALAESLAKLEEKQASVDKMLAIQHEQIRAGISASAKKIAAQQDEITEQQEKHRTVISALNKMVTEQQEKLTEQQEKMTEHQEKLTEQQEKMIEQQEKMIEQQEKYQTEISALNEMVTEQQEKLTEQQQKHQSEISTLNEKLNKQQEGHQAEISAANQKLAFLENLIMTMASQNANPAATASSSGSKPGFFPNT